MASTQVSKDEVKHIADLCKLNLSEKEIAKLSEMFSDTLNYISVLDELDVSKVKETYQVNGLTNVFAEKDEVNCTLSHKDALSNASDAVKGHFATKGVFDSHE